jgi:hypothetical protein
MMGFSITEIILEIIVVAIVLWLVGRWLVGKAASVVHAIWIAVLGVIIARIIGLIPVIGEIGGIISLIVWVYLIKRFFQTSWMKALIVGIVAAIVLYIVHFLIPSLP